MQAEGARVSRWVRVAGTGAILAAVPSAVWRVVVGAGIPLGIPEAWRRVQELPGAFATDGSTTTRRCRMTMAIEIADALGRACTFRVIAERPLSAGLLLVHSASLLHAPAGPRRGDTGATQTILVRDGEIVAFHNTVQQAMEEFTGSGSPENVVERAPRDPTL